MRTTIVLATLLFAGCSDEESPPVAPTDLVVSNVGGGGHLTWSDNSDDEDQFVIMRMTLGGTLAEIDTVPFDGVQYHDSAVTVGTTYVYQVVATNAAGESPSNEATFTP